MKRLNIILSLLLITFTACEKDQDMYKVAPADQLVAPVLAPHSAIVVTADNLSENVTFKWQRADFGVPTAVEYSLYAQVGVAEPVLVVSAFGDSLDVKIEDLNKKVIAAGAETDTETNVKFTLIAAINEGYATATSQSVVVKITAFKPLFPDNVYMTGADFGNWFGSEGTDPGIVEMTPVHSHEGQFWCVRYFTAGHGFKWNTKKGWGGDFNSLGTNVGFTIEGGNAVVATDGFYSVYIDYTINKITIEPAKVYGMGDCFGGWNAGQYPFTANGTVMKITTTAAGELRMYATSSAAQGVDWWQVEFIILDGKIEYRGTGNDQDRVNVTAGKTVTLNFNAETGTIE
jgi:hypothetical protein